MLITEKYRELNRQLHAENDAYGISAGNYRDFVFGLLKVEGFKSVLDYGCGKGVLKQLLPDAPISEYDPAISGKDGAPVPADLVCCFDVLEHIEPVCLNAVLRHLARLTLQKCVVTIATRPAQKFLADGRNAHISLHDSAWWRKKVQQHFQIMAWDHGNNTVFAELIPHSGPVLTEEALQRRKRRPIDRDLRQLCEAVRFNSRRYADVGHRIETIERWEGNGDKPADMIMAINILEHCADMDAALEKMCKLARLSVMVAMPCPENEAMWRGFLERRIRITDWMVETIQGQKRLVMSGGPCIQVQGVRGIGAVEDDTRWEQVAWSTPRFPKRIDVRPAHGRTAVLVCYGPSLQDQIKEIRNLALDPNCDVISVSGSHDYLLQHAIVPAYHVECDPRLHKADNMKAPHVGVRYLISSVVHPDYFRKLEEGGADIRLWHIAADKQTERLVDEMGEKSEHIISGGGSVGLRALPVLYSMGYRDFSIIGMDSSFRVADADMAVLVDALERGDAVAEKAALEKMADTSKQWAGKHAGKRQVLCSVACKVPGGARLFVSSPILLTYATYFFEYVQRSRDCAFRVYGDGLLQAMCALYMNPQPDQAAA
jgi:6-hydroxymethylpterin diphosphokinase MptE-like protein/methyltransferase family protein